VKLIPVFSESSEGGTQTGRAVGRKKIKRTLKQIRTGDSGGSGGADRWCGYIPTTPLDMPGSRTLTVEVHDGGAVQVDPRLTPG